jgi:ribosomal protein S18 acetylase RimI-like enzyme
MERCCINFTETYFALGRSAAGASTYTDDGVLGLTSSSTHPAANFIVAARPSLQSIERLSQLETIEKTTVYLLPTEDAELCTALLENRKFRITGRLAVMFERNGVRAGARLDLVPITDVQERTALVRQIAQMFFANPSESFLTELSLMTARAARCELLRLGPADNPQGGAMRVLTGDTVGLYNVAISPEARHKGTGAAMVSQIVREAHLKGQFCTLQCTEPLVEWYESLGFRRYGEIISFRTA